MLNVKPSALGLVNWNMKSLVNDCTLTGVVQNALATSPAALASVSGKREPLSLVCPLNCIPVAVKPEPKLIGVLPEPALMTYAAVATELGLKPTDVARAIIVSLAATVMAPVYWS